MRYTFSQLICAAVAVFSLGLGAEAASAACTKLGFSVNDYGKDGPTKDAKALLDKYIAKWAADKGIAKYTTGKKDVTCELFLNFIVFDEHTCRAEATVCWDGPAVKTGGETAAAGDTAAPDEKKPAKAAAAKPAKSEKIETGSTGSTTAPAAEAAKEAAPVEKATEAATPEPKADAPAAAQ